MNELLNNFPTEVRADIASISEQGGVLKAEQCQRICQQLSIKIESLMIMLLPIAASFSRAPISLFNVGAIAQGADCFSDGFYNLYLGANYEFENQALCHSVHAEQAAIANAWRHDEATVKSIATSAAPCGHCRQFLYEVAGTRSFAILMPKINAEEIDQIIEENSIFDRIELTQLLPDAFGPTDLGCDRLLMEQGFVSNHLELNQTSDDPLVHMALQAANLSYAPYTANFSGCVIEMNSGQRFVGRYAENAAHNPSLLAFSSALCHANLSENGIVEKNMKRVVMVEHVTKSCQRNVTDILVSACDNKLEFEYYSAIVIKK